MNSPNLQYVETLEKSFHIRHEVSSKGKSSPFHIHRDFELLYIRSASSICEVSDQLMEIPANSILLFNNTDLHRMTCSSSERYDRYIVYFKPEFFEGLFSEQTNLLQCFLYRPYPNAFYLPLDNDSADLLESALEYILQLYEGDVKFGSDLELKFTFGNLLVEVNRLYNDLHHLSEQPESSDYLLVYDVNIYINQNLAEDLSLDTLADRVFISKNQLCRLFRQVLNESPMQYVKKCRIMKAKELLLGGHTVGDTCERVGFKNMSHFSTAFKKETGCSPGQYLAHSV